MDAVQTAGVGYPESPFSGPEVSRRRFNLGEKMAPRRHGLTPVRRAVGAAVVLFLFCCAFVFYQLAPGFPTSGPSPSTAANSSSPAPTRVGTESATPTAMSSSTGLAKAISVEYSAFFAKPFQAVRIPGTYHGGADTFLWVERWEGGRWVAFPVPTKTDKSGKFTAFVELGRPGHYRLCVVDPDSGVRSEPFLLVIKR